MLIWEKKVPGGSPRKGILGIDTTRGDRLFVSLLGSAFIHLAWLGLVGSLCLLYTSPSPRDGLLSRMPSSA